MTVDSSSQLTPSAVASIASKTEVEKKTTTSATDRNPAGAEVTVTHKVSATGNSASTTASTTRTITSSYRSTVSTAVAADQASTETETEADESDDDELDRGPKVSWSKLGDLPEDDSDAEFRPTDADLEASDSESEAAGPSFSLKPSPREIDLKLWRSDIEKKLWEKEFALRKKKFSQEYGYEIDDDHFPVFKKRNYWGLPLLAALLAIAAGILYTNPDWKVSKDLLGIIGLDHKFDSELANILHFSEDPSADLLQQCDVRIKLMVTQRINNTLPNLALEACTSAVDLASNKTAAFARVRRGDYFALQDAYEDADSDYKEALVLARKDTSFPSEAVMRIRAKMLRNTWLQQFVLRNYEELRQEVGGYISDVLGDGGSPVTGSHTADLLKDAKAWEGVLDLTADNTKEQGMLLHQLLFEARKGAMQAVHDMRTGKKSG